MLLTWYKLGKLYQFIPCYKLVINMVNMVKPSVYYVKKIVANYSSPISQTLKKLLNISNIEYQKSLIDSIIK